MTIPSRKGDAAPTPREPEPPTRVYDDDAFEEPSRETVISVFGGSSRTGPWAPPELTRAVSGFGNVTLDFTRADLPPGTTYVEAWALFGNVVIRVPESLEVELSGVALLGNVVHRSAKGEPLERLRRWLRIPERDAPPPRARPDDEAILCVRGTAIFGNVLVKVV